MFRAIWGGYSILTKISVVAALVALLWGAWALRDHNLVKEANQKADTEQIKERNETDAEVNRADDAAKCKLIGGVYEDGSCN